MDLQKILESLSPVERKVLPFLKDGLELREISKVSKTERIEVMRALQWLENKGAIRVKAAPKEIVDLGDNGKIYADIGLPEKRFLEVLAGKMELDAIKKATGLDDNEIRICLGLLKARYAISIDGNEVKPTSERDRVLQHGFPEEALLKKLPKGFDDLSEDEKSIVSRLLKRKGIVKKDIAKFRYVELTELGKKLAKERAMKADLIGNRRVQGDKPRCVAQPQRIRLCLR